MSTPTNTSPVGATARHAGLGVTEGPENRVMRRSGGVGAGVVCEYPENGFTVKSAEREQINATESLVIVYCLCNMVELKMHE